MKKNYCKIIKTEKGRQYERDSKTPFTKWYTKGYSSDSEIIKILRAIESDTVYKLHPNKQSKVKKYHYYWKHTSCDFKDHMIK